MGNHNGRLICWWANNETI